MAKQYKETLNNAALFRGFAEEKLEQILALGKIKTLKKGEALMYSKTLLKGMYIVLEGRVKIVDVNYHGDELILELLQQADVFGDWQSERGERNYQYAAAITKEVTLLFYSQQNILKIMEDFPLFSTNMAQYAWEKLSQSNQRYSHFALNDTETRLLNFFKDWAMRDGKKIGKYIVMDNFLTHYDIANIICATRSTVTTLLNTWKKSGSISYSQKTIKIQDTLLAS